MWVCVYTSSQLAAKALGRRGLLGSEGHNHSKPKYKFKFPAMQIHNPDLPCEPFYVNFRQLRMYLRLGIKQTYVIICIAVIITYFIDTFEPDAKLYEVDTLII